MIIEAICPAKSGETFFFEYVKNILPMTRTYEIDKTKECALVVSEDYMWVCMFFKTHGGIFGDSTEGVVRIDLNTGRVDGNATTVPNADIEVRGTKHLWLYMARCLGYSFGSEDERILAAIDMIISTNSSGKLHVHYDGRIVQSSGYFASYPMIVKALSV